MRVILALPTVEPIAGFGDRDLYDSCIADLVAASGTLRSHDKNLQDAELTISHCELASEHPLVRDRWRQSKSLRKFGLLMVSADLAVFAREFRRELAADGRTWTESETSSLTQSYGAQNLMFEVNNLMLVANVLRPGALSAIAGFAFAHDAYVCETPAFFAEDWYRATRASEKYGWPPLHDLSIAQGWSWLASIGCIDSGIARNAVGRALAALSYTTPTTIDSESSLNLAWVLLGLEALYCTGNIGLREQLVAKSELVLGPRVENKKAFGAMYDFRSRLLHGDMDLPLRYSTFNAVPDFERHFDDLGDYEGLGLAVLISTLQVLIKNGWRGLTFQYGVNGLPVLPAQPAA